MNINITQFLTQCAAMGVWVFIVAGIWAMIEKYLDKNYPHLLALEAEGASQSPGPVVDDAPKKA